MDNGTYLISAILLGGIIFIAYLVNKKISDLSQKTQLSEDLLAWLRSTGVRLDEQNKVFTGAIQNSTKTLNERLDNTARVIAQVQKNIGEMSEIGRGMKDLQEFLRSPKLRGNIGEQVLKELLGQMLPKNSFNLQYTFKSGVVVDAAIKTQAGIIPVDSKFPLENFRKMMSAQSEAEKKEADREFVKDVKKHVDAISSKYIVTEEGTIDYALMYVPSEAVYYEIVNNSDLFDYSGKKSVLPVSPTTFYAYLRAILMSFEGQKIEARAKEIFASIRAIQKDYNKVEENLGVLGKHLQNAYNQMTNVSSGFNFLGQKLTSAQALGEKTEEGLKKIAVGENN
ncbi:MAG: DNA recombination protein RmuC [bacterium]|nr:DNA recombination protein RmuC [bacterium]